MEVQLDSNSWENFKGYLNFKAKSSLRISGKFWLEMGLSQIAHSTDFFRESFISAHYQANGGWEVFLRTQLMEDKMAFGQKIESKESTFPSLQLGVASLF